VTNILIQRQESSAEFGSLTHSSSQYRRSSKGLNSVSDFSEHFLECYKGSSLYKLRAGDYRAVVDWDKDNDLLSVRRIGHRDDFYDSDIYDTL
jgi:mRNA interferase RelE/StbE